MSGSDAFPLVPVFLVFSGVFLLLFSIRGVLFFFSLQLGLSGWADTDWVGSDTCIALLNRPQVSTVLLSPRYQLPFSTAPGTYIALLNRPSYRYYLGWAV